MPCASACTAPSWRRSARSRVSTTCRSRGTPGARGYEVLVRALKAGLLVRATGDTIALSPPLIISEAEIGKLTDILAGVLAGID